MLEKYDNILLLCYICQFIRWVMNLILFHYLRCILDGKYQQAMGMAVECRRLDKLEEAIVRCDNIQGALSYCINLSHQYVNHREYRFEVKACLKDWVLFHANAWNFQNCRYSWHIVNTAKTKVWLTNQISHSLFRFSVVLLKYTKLCQIQIIWAFASVWCF